MVRPVLENQTNPPVDAPETTCELSQDGDVLCVTPESCESCDDLAGWMEALESLPTEKKPFVLWDARNLRRCVISRPLEFEDLESRVTAVAVITDSPIPKSVVTLFSVIQRLAIPTGLFEDQSLALSWFEELSEPTR